MFDSIAPTYDLLNTVLSIGTHRLWERHVVGLLPQRHSLQAAAPLEKGKTVCLDLCTGTGALVPRLIPRFDQVVGADISSYMLAQAKRRFAHLKGVEWIEADAQQLPFSAESFTAISVAYGVRNLPSPLTGLREMYRVARPGAHLAVLEFGQPSNLLWRRIFEVYSRVVIPAIGGALSGNRAAYTYLPETSAAFPCGPEFEAILREAGWEPLKTTALMGGVAFSYLAKK
jgi:demethylmenaquinone methyltransferase/2-methoxy-6-polyprenyl-1,4-benzoquinol methylase